MAQLGLTGGMRPAPPPPQATSSLYSGWRFFGALLTQLTKSKREKTEQGEINLLLDTIILNKPAILSAGFVVHKKVPAELGRRNLERVEIFSLHDLDPGVEYFTEKGTPVYRMIMSPNVVLGDVSALSARTPRKAGETSSSEQGGACIKIPLPRSSFPSSSSSSATAPLLAPASGDGNGDDDDEALEDAGAGSKMAMKGRLSPSILQFALEDFTRRKIIDGMLFYEYPDESLGRVFRNLDELVPQTKYIADDHRVVLFRPAKPGRIQFQFHPVPIPLTRGTVPRPRFRNNRIVTAYTSPAKKEPWTPCGRRRRGRSSSRVSSQLSTEVSKSGDKENDTEPETTVLPVPPPAANGAPSAPPLPPPPPGMGKKKSCGPKFRPLHWLPIKGTSNIRGTVWFSSNKGSTAPPVDEKELTDIFGIRQEKKRSRDEDPSAASNKRFRSNKICLVGIKRANVIGVVLSQFRGMAFPAVRNGVITMDDTLLTADRLVALISILPITETESKMLSLYQGDVKDLCEADRFFLEMMQVPHLEYRLRTALFMLEFDARTENIEDGLEILSTSCTEMRGCRELVSLLRYVHSVGSVLNRDTFLSSDGFRVQSLLKLAETRANPESNTSSAPASNVSVDDNVMKEEVATTTTTTTKDDSGSGNDDNSDNEAADNDDKTTQAVSFPIANLLEYVVVRLHCDTPSTLDAIDTSLPHLFPASKVSLSHCLDEFRSIQETVREIRDFRVRTSTVSLATTITTTVAATSTIASSSPPSTMSAAEDHKTDAGSDAFSTRVDAFLHTADPFLKTLQNNLVRISSEFNSLARYYGESGSQQQQRRITTRSAAASASAGQGLSCSDRVDISSDDFFGHVNAFVSLVSGLRVRIEQHKYNTARKAEYARTMKLKKEQQEALALERKEREKEKEERRHAMLKRKEEEEEEEEEEEAISDEGDDEEENEASASASLDWIPPPITISSPSSSTSHHHHHHHNLRGVARGPSSDEGDIDIDVSMALHVHRSIHRLDFDLDVSGGVAEEANLSVESFQSPKVTQRLMRQRGTPQRHYHHQRQFQLQQQQQHSPLSSYRHRHSIHDGGGESEFGPSEWNDDSLFDFPAFTRRDDDDDEESEEEDDVAVAEGEKRGRSNGENDSEREHDNKKVHDESNDDNDKRNNSSNNNNSNNNNNNNSTTEWVWFGEDSSEMEDKDSSMSIRVNRTNVNISNTSSSSSSNNNSSSRINCSSFDDSSNYSTSSSNDSTSSTSSSLSDGGTENRHPQSPLLFFSSPCSVSTPLPRALTKAHVHPTSPTRGGGGGGEGRKKRRVRGRCVAGDNAQRDGDGDCAITTDVPPKKKKTRRVRRKDVKSHSEQQQQQQQHNPVYATPVRSQSPSRLRSEKQRLLS